jgi:DNA-directed RNA polymerase sigma subunit (sigma70/sigma32)
LSETNDKPVLSAVEAWMENLTELERDIIRAYFLDDYPGQKSDRLPDGVALLLAKKYNTTTSNLRHIKSKLETNFRENFRKYIED